MFSGGVHSAYLEPDFELRDNYSLTNAANSCGFYTDLAVDALSAQFPRTRLVRSLSLSLSLSSLSSLPLPLSLSLCLRGSGGRCAVCAVPLNASASLSVSINSLCCGWVEIVDLSEILSCVCVAVHPCAGSVLKQFSFFSFFLLFF